MISLSFWVDGRYAGAAFPPQLTRIARNAKEKTTGVTKAVRGLAADGSIFSDISKATNQLTKHVSINGFIGLAALANVISADEKDRKKALFENAGMFGSMLAFEGAHKAICGTAKLNDNKIEETEGLYRQVDVISKKVDKFKDFCNKQEEALKDCGEVKRFVGKMMKYLPSGLRGISFAAFSIGGSALGYYTFGKVAEMVE